MSEELKLCPFCGGEAVIFHGAFETTSAQCLSCGVETSLFEDSPSGSGKQKALAAWNRRAEPDIGNPATENAPLTLNEMRGMDGEPYYHVSLQGRGQRWAILPSHIAKNIQDYHYGKTWLAYRRKPEGV